MSKDKVTVFANMMVNDLERFQHLQDSFFSFKNISDDWIINIRGKLRNEVVNFLKDNLSDKGRFFNLLDEERGWFNNSIAILKEAKYDYILLWNEDHINIANENIYKHIISEMNENNIDYMIYTAWFDGEYRKAFEVDTLKEGQYIDIVYLTKNLWKKQLQKGYDYYLVSMPGIFKKDFLLKILNKERGKLPRFITTNLFRSMIYLDKIGLKFNHRKSYDFINRLLFCRLTKWTKYKPFDLEKSPYRFDILPLNIALPKHELFGCIDDDIGFNGSQLIKRGLYPLYKELSVDSGCIEKKTYGNKELVEKNKDYTITKFNLLEGKSIISRYYEDEPRTINLLRKTIILIKGDLSIATNDMSVNLSVGQTVSLYMNIEHKIQTKSGALFLETTSSLHNKKIKCIF